MLSPEQRAARRFAIGSSDAPAVLGVDPHRSRLEVYLSKVHDLEEDEETEPMRLGNRFEQAILEEAAERLGVRIHRDVTVQGPEPYLAANLDAVVLDGGEGRVPLYPRGDGGARLVAVPGGSGLEQSMEAKFTGLGHLFGEPGTDALPDRVLVQTGFQMGCLESLQLVHVPVLLARWGRPRVELYQAPRHQELVEVILEQCRRFWVEHVLPHIPPDPTPGYGEATLKVLRRVRREPASVAHVESALAWAFQEAYDAYKAAEDAKARAQAALLAAMGDAEGADFGDPKKLYTYLESVRHGIDTKALLRDLPHLEQKYHTETRYRTLRLVNKKVGGRI